jgi:hypothetical protein
MRRKWLSSTLLVLGLTTGIPAAEEGFKAIFDGMSPQGWMTNLGKPLPRANVQDGALNPHASGGYIVVYEKPYRDFVLDFEYKISPGCNSGVFLRVGDLKEPVMTGLEIAIDDTTGIGMHDPGAFYDLVSPRVNAQKPAGQWNRMTITARGPKITVNLNGQDVSDIDLAQFDKPGKRPDGTSHKFKDVTMKDLNRPGYFGFQDHESDCWYKNIRLRDLD